MRKELPVEMIIVGASTAVAGMVLSRTGIPTGKPIFWFALGAVVHLGWEVVGGNRWYVETRKPEQFPKGWING